MTNPKLRQIKYNLPVMLMQQGSHFIVYTPALELTVQGKTKDEVHTRFNEAVGLFFEELDRMGTMEEVLEELGWQKLPQQAWQPPQLIDAPTTYEVPVPAYA